MTEEAPLVTRGAILATAAFALGGMAVAALSPGALDAPDDAAAEKRLLTVVDSVHDGMELRDGRSGDLVAQLKTEGDLFAMTALRSVAGRVGARPETGRFSVLVAHRADGTGYIQYPATGRIMPIEGFGPDNSAALLSLLASEGGEPEPPAGD